jgi:hypothetical protein
MLERQTMTLSNAQLRHHWQSRYPQQFGEGREDALRDIASGSLRLKLQVGAFPRPLLGLLVKKGIEPDLCGDVGGPHPAYHIAYNFQMETEIDSRFGHDTVRTLWDRAELLHRQRRRKAD